ncbi:MAG TPA: hypothetical protein VHB98_19005 [Chloroflexota bacterium]|jgi:hypothetical protein|nr:hypothetical protein [Chloroflexota bacterium]
MNWRDPLDSALPAPEALGQAAGDLDLRAEAACASPVPARPLLPSAAVVGDAPRPIVAPARRLRLVPPLSTPRHGLAGLPPEQDLDRSLLAMPPFLRHLHRLTAGFQRQGEAIPFIHAHARPLRAGGGRPLLFEPPAGLADSEAASLGETARAALLGLQVYEWTRAEPALSLARQWLRAITSLQRPDGTFAQPGEDIPRAGGPAGSVASFANALWAAQARWALAMAWRVTRDARYLHCFHRGHMEPTGNLQALALQALALMELYQAAPDPALRARICDRCARICSSGDTYFPDLAGQDAVRPGGYYQLLAVARAGRLFSRLDFLRACQRTVTSLVEPILDGGFFHLYPRIPDPQCASDIAPLALGLEELHQSLRRSAYRALALRCIDWLYGNNPAGSVVYDRNLGCCADAVQEGEVSRSCGADAAIAAGFMELAHCRLCQR